MGYAVRAGRSPPLPRRRGKYQVLLREGLPRGAFACQGEGWAGVLQPGCCEVLRG